MAGLLLFKQTPVSTEAAQAVEARVANSKSVAGVAENGPGDSNVESKINRNQEHKESPASFD